MTYLTKPDITKIFELLCGGIPNAKFTKDTVRAWSTMFGHVDRLRLLDCAKQFMTGTEVVQNRVSATGKFFPTVSEINVILKKHKLRNPHWRSPRDKKDERCLWYMALNGITDPSKLTQKQVDEIYEIDHKKDMRLLPGMGEIPSLPYRKDEIYEVESDTNRR